MRYDSIWIPLTVMAVLLGFALLAGGNTADAHSSYSTSQLSSSDLGYLRTGAIAPPRPEVPGMRFSLPSAPVADMSVQASPDEMGGIIRAILLVVIGAGAVMYALRDPEPGARKNHFLLAPKR